MNNAYVSFCPNSDTSVNIIFIQLIKEFFFCFFFYRIDNCVVNATSVYIYIYIKNLLAVNQRVGNMWPRIQVPSFIGCSYLAYPTG